ncbi:MAG: sensor histidine kinase, partial [Tissierellia bacterium]|nr:sensor histidine kinase [Tissierellia bacterium]
QELISKSVVIQEIHHRVKNNLQTIASLIRMQSRRINDPRIKISHQESINRILSIAVTHEILAKNISGMIDVHEMIILLIQNTIYQGDGNDKIITVDVEGDKITVDSNKATSIALIVNELMSNAFEHAFKHRKEGNVTIHIQKKTLISTISVIDNGEGFPSDIERQNSFGLSIVKGLAKETLKGDVVIDSTEKGTKVTFSFLNK